MAWDLADFAIAGALLIGTGFVYRLAAARSRSIAYRAAVGVSLVAALLLIWMNLAVGIIGDESHSANGMYVGVLAVAIIAAVFARFRPHGMALALFATAFAQALVTVITLIFALGAPASGPMEIFALNVFFITLWIGSALLFRHAARVDG